MHREGSCSVELRVTEPAPGLVGKSIWICYKAKLFCSLKYILLLSFLLRLILPQSILTLPFILPQFQPLILSRPLTKWWSKRILCKEHAACRGKKGRKCTSVTIENEECWVNQMDVVNRLRLSKPWYSKSHSYSTVWNYRNILCLVIDEAL